MSKNNFYFSHDGNARNDEKLLAVRMDMGAEGYGIYFMIIEKLLESSDYILVKDYNVIAFDLRVGSDKIKAVIENFGLFHFTEDGKRFYSESLLRRMKPLDNLRKQRSEAGKKSAESRKKNDRSTTVEKESNKTPFLLGKNSTKESKVNNISFLEKKKQKIQTLETGESSEKSESQEPETKSREANENPDLKTEDGKKKKVAAKKKKANPPEISEFLTYCEDLVLKNNLGDFSLWKFTLEAKYNAWADANWCDGNGKPIANWKTKIQNTLPFLKPINNGQKTNTTGNYTRANARGSYPTGQKISARAFLAKQYSEQLARNSEAGNITIEVETSPSE